MWPRLRGPFSSAAAPPIILQVYAIDDGPTVGVVFDQAMSLPEPYESTLTVNGNDGSWDSNIDANTLMWRDNNDNNHTNFQPWELAGPEAGITPQPAYPQSGEVV